MYITVLLINKNLMFSSLLVLLVSAIDYGEREREREGDIKERLTDGVVVRTALEPGEESSVDPPLQIVLHHVALLVHALLSLPVEYEPCTNRDKSHKGSK